MSSSTSSVYALPIFLPLSVFLTVTPTWGSVANVNFSTSQVTLKNNNMLRYWYLVRLTQRIWADGLKLDKS